MSAPGPRSGRIAPDTADAAVHGSFCPKMCTFACPVTAATGRDDAVPWNFHRTVADVATGRLDAADAGPRLTACTGCLACRVPCLFEQDVPAQVRAGRAAVVDAGAAPASVAAAVEAVAAGRSPYAPADDVAAPEADAGVAPGTTALLVGCRDEQATVRAVLDLLAAAGAPARPVAPDGCCGALLADLGAVDDAGAATARLATRLEDAGRLVVLDPHCLPATRVAVGERVEVVHVVEELARLAAAARLTFDGELGPVTYHDPCLLARAEGVVQEPRTLLGAAGAELIEPEHHGAATACAGAGLGLELVDVEAAEATASRRRGHLEATGAPTVVTACAGARQRLAADGREVHDLAVLLARHLTGD